MEEKKKISPVIIILIIILLGSLSYIGYDKFIAKDTDSTKESNTKEESNAISEEKTNTEVGTTYKDYQEDINFMGENYIAYYKFTTNDNYVSTVPVEDLLSLSINKEGNAIDIHYAILKNGKVYYYSGYVSKENDLIEFNSVFENNENIKLNELTGLSGKVKRIKNSTMGTGVTITQILIMENGSVYTFFISDGKTYLKKIDELSKYKVDNIISWNQEMIASYKVILTDGTVLTKTLKYIN